MNYLQHIFFYFYMNTIVKTSPVRLKWLYFINTHNELNSSKHYENTINWF